MLRIVYEDEASDRCEINAEGLGDLCYQLDSLGCNTRFADQWFKVISIEAVPKALPFTTDDIEVCSAPVPPRGGMRVDIATGVRVRHKQTGTIVEVTSERSQYKNRELALQGLATILSTQK